MPDVASPAERSRGLLRALHRRRVVAIAAFVVCFAVAALAVLSEPKQYDATAQILLQPTDQIAATLSPGAATSPANAQRDVDTYAKLITAAPVIDAVQERLGLTGTNGDVADRITVDGQADSNLVSIIARDTSPREATLLASAVATAYTDYRRASARRAIESAITAGRQSLQELRGRNAPAAQRQAVADRVQALIAQEATETGGVQLVRAAEVPSEPSAPNVPLRLAVALILALAVAVAAALLVDRVDRRIIDDETLEAALGTRILTRVNMRRRGERREDGYADLAARLQHALPVANHNVVLVVASRRNGAAAEVSAGLAVQLAAQARPTLLIEADLRRGDAAGGQRGLVQLLTGDATLREATAAVHLLADSDDPVSFGLVPAGGRPGNPAALLARPELGDVLRSARATAETVVVDGGSALPVADVTPLAALADGIVVVIETRRLTHARALELRAALEAHADRVLGIVALEGFGTRGSSGPTIPLGAGRLSERSGTAPVDWRIEQPAAS